MQAAAGLWANREDMPDYNKLRNEFDREDSDN
jgi:hypothetical protein